MPPAPPNSPFVVDVGSAAATSSEALAATREPPPPSLQLSMRGMAVDTAGGRLFLSLPELNVVLLLNSSTQERLGSLGGATRYAASPLAAPSGLAYQPSTGWLFIADRGSNRVLVAKPDRSISVLAGTGAAGGADGAASSATFSGPTGLAMDAAGNLYVSDSSGARVRRVAAGTFAVSTIAGNGSAGYVDGPGSAACFRAPRGLAVSPDGAVVDVADSGNNRLRRLSYDATYRSYSVATVAGGGSWFTLADGYGAAASFNTPLALARDADGTLLVADYGFAALRLVTPAGYVTTVRLNAGAALPAGRPLGVASGGEFMTLISTTLTDAYSLLRVVQSPPPSPPPTRSGGPTRPRSWRRPTG